MLFLVRMKVSVPPDADAHEVAGLQRDERDLSRRLQHEGIWRHLWRVVGRYENVSIFDVDSHEQLHEVLTSLPLWPYLDIATTPLAAHPSAIEEDAVPRVGRG